MVKQKAQQCTHNAHGIVYIWDAMTVVIQRTYFKATHGKRIFRMTPIHHAFEMRGWREVKIDGFFALIAVIGVAMGGHLP